MNKSQELFSCEMSASILVVNPKILITLMVFNTFTSITATIGNLLVLSIAKSTFALYFEHTSVRPCFVWAVCWTNIWATKRWISSCTFQEFRQNYILYTYERKNLHICLFNNSHPVNCNSNECWSLSSDISAPEIWTSGHRQEYKESHSMPLVDWRRALGRDGFSSDDRLSCCATYNSSLPCNYFVCLDQDLPSCSTSPSSDSRSDGCCYAIIQHGDLSTFCHEHFARVSHPSAVLHSISRFQHFSHCQLKSFKCSLCRNHLCICALEFFAKSIRVFLAKAWSSCTS